MVKVKLKWNKQEFDLEIDENETGEVLKTQIWTLTKVPPERQKILGIPGGPIKDDVSLTTRKIKEGSKVTLIGTAEGGELAAPEKPVVFIEDLTSAERAKLFNEEGIKAMPVGLANLGNTCYMNSVIQMLRKVPELETIEPKPSADADGKDVMLATEFKALSNTMKSSLEPIQPMRFLFALRAKVPEFERKGNGGQYAQQDAEECMRHMLTSFAAATPIDGGNTIDKLFGYQKRESYKCLENEEPLDVRMTSDRFMFCHFGSSTDPISHLSQGVKLSLTESIEKESPSLGRTAQYEKTSALTTSPPYLLCQFARFGWKAAAKSAGTEASRVKIGRKVTFPKRLDIQEFCTEEFQKELIVGKRTESEAKDAELEKQRLADSKLDDDKDEKKEPEKEVEMVERTYDTGVYELVAVVSHAGRSADGGHYVAWSLEDKADGKKVKEDTWHCYDDEKVTKKMDREVDLSGGRLDTQIAYFCLYKKVPYTGMEPKDKKPFTEEVKEGEKAEGEKAEGEKAEKAEKVDAAEGEKAEKAAEPPKEPSAGYPPKEPSAG